MEELRFRALTVRVLDATRPRVAAAGRGRARLPRGTGMTLTADELLAGGATDATTSTCRADLLDGARHGAVGARMSSSGR